MGPAASVKQERAIAAIRARLAPSDDTRFQVELLLAYGRTGKQRVIDAYAAIADGEAETFDGTTYIETTGRVVSELS